MLWYQRLYADVKFCPCYSADREATYLRYDDGERALLSRPYGDLFMRYLDTDADGINLPHLRSRAVWLSESLARPVEVVAFTKIADAIANSLEGRHPFMEPVRMLLGEMIRLTDVSPPTDLASREMKLRFLEIAKGISDATDRLIETRRRVLAFLQSGAFLRFQEATETGGSEYYQFLSENEKLPLPVRDAEQRCLVFISPETPVLEAIVPDLSAEAVIGAYFREVLLGKARIRQCGSCGGFFIQRKKYNYLYCERINEDGRSCRQTGAAHKHRSKVETSPMLAQYRRTYNRLFSRMRAGHMEKDEFKKWQAQARERMARVEKGKLVLSDFVRWLDRQ